MSWWQWITKTQVNREFGRRIKQRSGCITQSRLAVYAHWPAARMACTCELNGTLQHCLKRAVSRRIWRGWCMVKRETANLIGHGGARFHRQRHATSKTAVNRDTKLTASFTGPRILAASCHAWWLFGNGWSPRRSFNQPSVLTSSTPIVLRP